MTKHAKKSAQLHLVDRPRTTNVKIPLPLLSVFANIEMVCPDFDGVIELELLPSS